MDVSLSPLKRVAFVLVRLRERPVIRVDMVIVGGTGQYMCHLSLSSGKILRATRTPSRPLIARLASILGLYGILEFVVTGPWAINLLRL